MSSPTHANTIGSITADILNVRSGPSTSYTIVDKTYYGEKINIISRENKWYKIARGTGQFAYVHSDYVNEISSNTPDEEAKEYETGRVTASILNFRSGPQISNNIIGKLSYSDTVTILSTHGDWYYVSTQNNTKGYVYAKYISKVHTNVSDVRKDLIEYAEQFLGNPYVYGGTSLTNGVDCSSYTQQILGAFNYNISRTSYYQINDGVRISQSELLPGDLVFYGYSGRVSHVAIYYGDGKIIHASSPSTGIRISNMLSSYGKPYIGASRVILD